MSKRDNSTKLEGRKKAVEKISAHILQHGLPQTSLRQLAAAAGISDRMLLYYFSDKSEVLSEVLGAVANELSSMLEEALPETVSLPTGDLFAQIAQLLRDPNMRPYLHLGIELSAAAVRGAEPFSTIARHVAEGYMEWIEARLNVSATEDRRGHAAMILGLIDGLAIISVVGRENEFDLALEAAIQMLDQTK